MYSQNALIDRLFPYARLSLSSLVKHSLVQEWNNAPGMPFTPSFLSRSSSVMLPPSKRASQATPQKPKPTSPSLRRNWADPLHPRHWGTSLKRSTLPGEDGPPLSRSPYAGCLTSSGPQAANHGLWGLYPAASGPGGEDQQGGASIHLLGHRVRSPQHVVPPEQSPPEHFRGDEGGLMTPWGAQHM